MKTIKDIKENLENKIRYLDKIQTTDAYEHGKKTGMKDGFEYCLDELKEMEPKKPTKLELILVSAAVLVGCILAGFISGFISGFLKDIFNYLTKIF